MGACTSKLHAGKSNAVDNVNTMDSTMMHRNAWYSAKQNQLGTFTTQLLLRSGFDLTACLESDAAIQLITSSDLPMILQR